MPTRPTTATRTPAAECRPDDDDEPGRRSRSQPLRSRSSADLAVAARTGNREAAGELFRRTHGRARRVACAFCREVDADDAVTEGLFRALRRLDQLRDPAAVESWMLRCVARSAVDLSRKGLRLMPTGDMAALSEQALPAGESADQAAMSVLDRASMAAARGELPPHLRLLLYLRYDAELPVTHIALVLGRPAGTVRRQCTEARRAAGERFLGYHLRPAVGVCAQVSALLCQEPYRRPSVRAERQASEHLRRCHACRDRQAEVAAVLRELGYRRPSGGHQDGEDLLKC